MKKEEYVIRNLLLYFVVLMMVVMSIHFYLTTKEHPQAYKEIADIFFGTERPK